MDFAPYQSSPPEASRPRSSLTLQRPFSPPRSTYAYQYPGGTSTASTNANPNTIGSSRLSSSSPPPQQYSYSPSPPPWAGVGGGVVGGGTRSGNGSGSGSGSGFSLGNFARVREGVEDFDTSLPIRLDYEAMLAYLFLPPAGGVLLLILEHKSDYVRFHAWQSSLLFSALAIIHLLVSWSRFLTVSLFLVDVGLIGYLTVSAYRDADTLDRCEVPFFGRVASGILDDE